MKALLAMAAGAAALLGSQAAAASFTMNFGASSQTSNDDPTGAAATVLFSFADVSGDVEISFLVTNTTGLDPLEGPALTSKLTGFAFDGVLDVLALSAAPGAALVEYLTDVDFSPFSGTVGNFDFAFADDMNFEGGNANDALAEGDSDSMSLLVDTAYDAVSLMAAFYAAFEDESAHAAMRFMQVDGEGSDKLLYLTGNLNPVPVPGAAILMLSGLAAAGVARRKLAR